MPQEVRWAEFYAKGSPIKNICLLDLLVVVEGFLGLKTEEAAAKYHAKDSSGKEFKIEFGKAKEIKSQMLQAAGTRLFSPSGAVTVVRSQLRTVYYEVGFLSESEFEKIVGAPAKDFKLKPVTLQIEDGTSLKGHYISLLGLSPDQLGWIRKIKVEEQIKVNLDEKLCASQLQIRQKQPPDHCDLATKGLWEKAASQIKPATRHSLPKISSLKRKMEETEQEPHKALFSGFVSVCVYINFPL